MSIQIIKEISSLLSRSDTIKTSDLIEKLDNGVNKCEMFKTPLRELKVLDVKHLEKHRVKKVISLSNTAGIDGKDFKTIINNLTNTVDGIEEGLRSLIDLIEQDDTKYYMLDTLTAKQSAIILYGQRLLNTLDVLYQLLIFIVYGLQQEEFIYKKKLSTLEEALNIYSSVIVNLSKKDIRKKVLSITKLSNSPIKEEDELTLSDRAFRLPGRSNFNGNPIYHILRWWQDRQFEEYEKNKYEVKLLQLKLAELQLKAQDKDTPLNIQEQIKYYEDEIAKLERKIEEFRNN